jgi:peroxiredoxin
VQLSADHDRFRKLGLRIAGISYDPVPTLQAFAAKNALAFPLLHDADARAVNAYGIRNEQYAPGHRAYGIPHPGMLWIDRDGVVRAKFAEPDYRERPDDGATLAALEALLGPMRPAATEPAAQPGGTAPAPP